MEAGKSKTPFYIENTYHWPPDGEIRPWTEFWVTTFTRPVGAASQAVLHYSCDQGSTWDRKPMDKSCVSGERDVWHVNLGTFAANTHLHYAVTASDPQGRSLGEHPMGDNHQAVVGTAKDRA